MTGLRALVRETVESILGEFVFRAIVTGTSGNRVLVRRATQTAADAQAYPRLAAYSSPTVADEVLVIRLGGGFLVVGKIVR
jgi:hypothetical protein